MPRELSLADIFQIGYYWETKILLTAVSLDVFSVLQGGSFTVNQVAEKMSVNARALELLMNALVAMRILNHSGKEFSNTPVAD
ncbi:MAG: hypothetical protein KC545_11770, partial [Nitrospira sp.]|nr:hypothetical protein [Nitrospira sp.]